MIIFNCGFSTKANFHIIDERALGFQEHRRESGIGIFALGGSLEITYTVPLTGIFRGNIREYGQYLHVDQFLLFFLFISYFII